MSPDLKIIANKRFVGITAVSSQFPAGCAEMSIMEDHWFLNRCLVKKPHRKNGLGREMIEKLKEHSEGIRIIVTPGGDDAPLEGQIAFYEKCGFKKVGKGNEVYWQWES